MRLTPPRSFELTTTPAAASPQVPHASAAGLPASALLLLAAIAAGVRAQGGFYATGQVLIGVLVVASAIAAMRTGRIRATELGRPAVFAVALALWSTACAVAAHHATAAIPGDALLATLVVTFVVVARLGTAQRLWLADALTLIGIAAGLSGWFGVAAHVSPLAHGDQGLWRAATTLTYANAAAGLLVPIGFVALARLAQAASRREAAVRSLGVTVLFVAVGSTFSRGGAIAALTGVGVLAVLGNRRAIARALAGPIVGAAVALAGLLPSVPQNAHVHLFIASGSFVAGLGIAVAMSTVLTGRRVPAVTSEPSARRTRLQIPAVFAAVAAVAAIGLTTSGPVRHAAAAVAHPRLTATSDDRVGESSAAAREIAKKPLLGAGAGTQSLRWTTSDEAVMFDRYAHDEYLQVAWKSGMVGLVLLLAMFAAFARRIGRGRRDAPSHELWAGSVAGLCGLAVASGLDFLWHVPVIPLAGVVLAGLCTPKQFRGSGGGTATDNA